MLSKWQDGTMSTTQAAAGLPLPAPGAPGEAVGNPDVASPTALIPARRQSGATRHL